MECEFCKKIFKTKSSLINHQKTVKSCLILQGKNEDEETLKYNCGFCKKNFSRIYNLERHEYDCKIKKQEEKENVLKQLEEYKLLKDENKKLKSEIKNQKYSEKDYEELKKIKIDYEKEISILKFNVNNYEKQISELNKKIEKYEDLLIKKIENDDKEKSSLLQQVILKPSTNTTNTVSNTIKNTYNLGDNLVCFNKENITERFDSLTNKHYRSKLEDFCKSLVDKLSDMIVTTDIARQIVAIKPEEGNIERLHSTLAVQKAIELYDSKNLEVNCKKAIEKDKEWMNTLDDEIRGQYQLNYTENLGNIKDLQKNTNNKIICTTANHLSKKTYKKALPLPEQSIPIAEEARSSTEPVIENLIE
jgi:hypothetical protein